MSLLYPRVCILLFLAEVIPATIVKAQDFSQSSWCKTTGKYDPNQKRDLQTEAAQLRFAANTYAALSKNSPASSGLVYSPFSIHTAVAMTATGARGPTADQLMTTLGFPAGTALAAVANLTSVFRSIDCPGSYNSTTLSVANGIFVQEGKPLNKSFTQTLNDAYDARAEQVDFRQHPKEASKIINQWVADKTANKIVDLLSPDAITPEMKLTLVNTVYINGPWKGPFPEKATASADFFLSPNKAVKTKMMHRIDESQAKSNYFESTDYRAIGLPTADQVVQLILISPKGKTPLATIEKKLNETFLAKTVAGLGPRTLDLKMPKFKIRQSQKFQDILSHMGAKLAMRPGADFSGIDGGADKLYISSIVHQAVVEVHEKGLEAAAATAVMMETGRAHLKPETPLKVTIDRPFLFVIWSQQGNVPIFMGRVVDPR